MNENEKKINRLKGWASRNREQLLGWGFVAGVTGLYVGAIALAVRAAHKQEAEWDAAVTDALTTGKTIIPQKDGSFYILDMNKIA